jgi:lambda family phage tail tape measure protein
MAKTGVKDATVSMEQFHTILKGLGMEITAKFGEIQVRRDAINQLLDKTDKELREKGITKLQLRMELIGLDQSEDDLRRLKASIQDVSHAYVDMRTAAGEAETGKGSQYEMQKAYNLLLHDTANEVVLIQDRYVQGTQDYNNAMRDLLTNVLPQITTFQFTDPDYIKDQDTITKNYKKMANDARAWKGAVAEGFKVVGDVKVFDTLRDIVVNAFQGMTDAIVDFVDTGKVNFHDMAMSMLKDLLRLEIQLQIMKPMAAWMGGMWEGVFSSAKPMASGGIIEEHIIGMGKSGKRYEFGEQGPEMVTPLGSSTQTSAPIEVHIHNAPQGTTVRETTTSRGGKRIDVMIDEIVSRKLAGGSMSQGTLRSMYGLRPALVGR